MVVAQAPFCMNINGTIYPLPLLYGLVHTALKSGTEPIRYMTLHFRDRRGAASRCYRNRAEIFVFANKRECCKLMHVWYL